MPIQSFIPRSGLYRHQESSSLAPLSGRNSPGQAWKSQRHDAIRSEKHTANVSQIQKQLARLERRNSAGNGMHPFKIYNFPSSLRRFHNADDWRRFKVRAGFAQIAGAALQTFPGTDDMSGGFNYPTGPSGDTYLGISAQVPPVDNSQTNSDGIFSTWNEIAIPRDHRTYLFWWSWVLPIFGGSWGGITKNIWPYGIAVCPDSDPTAAKIMLTLETFDATAIWPSLPESDRYNTLIGTVTIDDGTLVSIFPEWPTVAIQQFAFDNITLPFSPYGTSSGLQIQNAYRGDYRADIKYYVGDSVTISYADGTGVHSLYQYIYDPPALSAYHPTAIPGPMLNISPNGNSPDPWKMLSKSPKDADYHTDGSYQAAKAYLRTA